MKKLFTAFLLALTVVVAGCVSPSNLNKTENTTGGVTGEIVAGTDGGITGVTTIREHTIEITDTGYVPNNLTIKAGDRVVFVNKGTKPNWPASASHPTHKVYPGSDITKCGTEEETRIFDACREILPGESWSFTFTEKGSWAYHEHLEFKMFGRINVE